MSPSTFQ